MSNQDLTHPPATKLDAIAAGDDPGPASAHLATCAPCTQYVAKLRQEAAAFRTATDPRAFVASIEARAAKETGAPRVVTPIRVAPRAARVAYFLAPTLAAAAAIVLWLRAAPESPSLHGVGTATSSSVAAHDVARFKGGPSVAVIRERNGHQDRLTGPFEVAPSDRIRVEIAVDHEAPVVAGLLSTDGTWTPLLTPTVLSAGTHYSELAARFDETPTDSLLLVGPPAAVERARATLIMDGIVAWRVRSVHPE